jgi:molecular chaperone GrpE
VENKAKSPAPNSEVDNGQGASETGAAESPELVQARKKIAELEALVKEKESKYLYLYAEFENFKKRMVKERSDLLKYGWEGLAHELLEVVDNLERALAHLPAGTDKNVAGGLNMILSQFRSTLQKQGVQEIGSLNSQFDPNVHEAVAHEPSEKPEGTITHEHNRGYTLHGRLLRPARVTVSAGSPGKQ